MAFLAVDIGDGNETTNNPAEEVSGYCGKFALSAIPNIRFYVGVISDTYVVADILLNLALGG